MSSNYQYVNNDRRDACWFCGGRLIWGADVDACDYGYGERGIVTTLSCAGCNAKVTYVKLEEEE